jgi:hypothetical protein
VKKTAGTHLVRKYKKVLPTRKKRIFLGLVCRSVSFGGFRSDGILLDSLDLESEENFLRPFVNFTPWGELPPEVKTLCLPLYSLECSPMGLKKG